MWDETIVAVCVCKEVEGLNLVKQVNFDYQHPYLLAVDIMDFQWRLGKGLLNQLVGDIFNERV